MPAAFPTSWRGLGHPGFISACGSFQFLAKFIYEKIIEKIIDLSELRCVICTLEVSPGNCDLLPHPGFREQRGLLDIIWSGRGGARLVLVLL